MNAVEQALGKYVEVLGAKHGFASEPVKRAFETVRRHRFLDGWYHLGVTDAQVNYRPVSYDRDRPTADQLSEIYSDKAIITETDGILPTSSTSQPTLVARMLELLDLEPGMRVLEIGSGTGYNAALLAEIVGSGGSVCTVELQETVARAAERHLRDEGYMDVHVVCRDGFLGVPEAGPFDRIVATVGCSDISPHWIEQLVDDGSILLPLQHGLYDPLTRLTKDPESSSQMRGRVVGNSGFMQVQGALDWTAPWRNRAIVGLPKTPAWSKPLPAELAVEADSGHPLREESHQAFAFFLALGLRPLRYTNEGYGLADPATSSVVIVTHDAIEGYTALSSERGLGSVCESLLALLETWQSLGRPSVSDYDLTLVPKAHVDLRVAFEGEPGRDWWIERPFSWECVHLREEPDP
jgi:protein-L-isoaspartate(D-aspartate) O-methyltransferase